MTAPDPEEPLNPLKLAATLHWQPDTPIAAGDVESKRVLDYWLHQIDHFDPLFAPEYIEAPALLAELLIEEPGHAARLSRVGEDQRFHHWGLCQHLLAESERAVESSTLLARELSELAVAIALRLDAGHYQRRWTEDIRAKAWCVYGDTCRRLSRTEEALVAAGEAKKHARAGTSSAELAARVEKLEMSLNRRVNGARLSGGGRLPAGAPPNLRVADDPSSHTRAS